MPKLKPAIGDYLILEDECFNTRLLFLLVRPEITLYKCSKESSCTNCSKGLSVKLPMEY